MISASLSPVLHSPFHFPFKKNQFDSQMSEKNSGSMIKKFIVCSQQHVCAHACGHGDYGLDTETFVKK